MVSIKEWFEATFNGIAQIAFSNNLKSGYFRVYGIADSSYGANKYKWNKQRNDC